MKIQEFAQVQGLLDPNQNIEIEFHNKMSIISKMANIAVLGMSANAGLIRAVDNEGDTFYLSTEEIALIMIVRSKK